MTIDVWRLFDELAARQHGVAAVWQLIERHVPRRDIDRWVREHRGLRLHRGVYGVPAGVFGGLKAATLAVGPEAAVGAGSGVGLWGMREHPGTIHVGVPGPGGRSERDGFVIHRVRPFEIERCNGIPVMSPTRCLQDARLPRYAAYRALEAAEAARLQIDHHSLASPVLREVREVLALGMNPTRSDAEARFIFHCRDRGIEMPVVNAMLNGVETDFHWPRARLVLEVDGWEHHRERAQFEEDRRRNVIHRIAGYEIVRVSARQVQRTPDDVCAAVLAAAPYLQAA